MITTPISVANATINRITDSTDSTTLTESTVIHAYPIHPHTIVVTHQCADIHGDQAKRFATDVQRLLAKAVCSDIEKELGCRYIVACVYAYGSVLRRLRDE